MTEKKCASPEETISLILIYSVTRFSVDFLSTLRDIPFQRMAANAEIAIADEVYHHVQSLSLAYHLSRETGKLIRNVSRGSKSFVNIVRHIFYNLFSIFIQLVLTAAIALTMFYWHFTVIQLFQFLLYFGVTYFVTEKRLKNKKDKKNADNNYN